MVTVQRSSHEQREATSVKGRTASEIASSRSLSRTERNKVEGHKVAFLLYHSLAAQFFAIRNNQLLTRNQ